MSRPALFVVKATIAPELEAAFNDWYDSVRAAEASRVPGCVAMRRYAPIPVESAHAGHEAWPSSRTCSGRSRGLAHPMAA